MHIAFVTPESPYGDAAACGVASYLRAIIPAICDAGHQVTVFAKAKEEQDFLAEDGRVCVHHFPLPSLHWYSSKIPVVRQFAPLPLRQLEWSREFYRRVGPVAAQEKIDVIESTETGSLYLAQIAPLVIRLHGSEFTFRKHSGTPLDLSVKWSDALEGRACKRAAAITSPSRSQIEEISPRRGWPAERVRVIPNPISAKLLRAAREFHRNGNRERIALYTGRLAPVKGIDTLLTAAALVHEKDPSVRFVLAGPWQMPGSPEAYGLKLNESSASGVQWIGPQRQTELIEWYKRAQLFVMPSHYESFGISVVEALAFGLPVIATDASGLKEALGTNPAASFVARGNAPEMAKAILAAITREKQERLPACDPIHNFSVARVAEETIKLYEEVQRNDAPAKTTHG
jgi:glycosyltransferase involved in cell wall biosynthesis